MIKFKSKRFSRSNSKRRGAGDGSGNGVGGAARVGGCVDEIKWELRPGGMLVQKRESEEGIVGEGMITVRVSTVSQWHDITIGATLTFGNLLVQNEKIGQLKMILSLVTSLDPKEQRLLFKGKEREDSECLHMVGVREKDKMLLLEDPATKERKLLGLPPNCSTVSV